MDSEHFIGDQQCFEEQDQQEFVKEGKYTSCYLFTLMQSLFICICLMNCLVSFYIVTAILALFTYGLCIWIGSLA
jgi:hypothetical protein